MLSLLELTAKDLAEVGKGGRYVRVKNAGHDIQVTDPTPSWPPSNRSGRRPWADDHLRNSVTPWPASALANTSSHSIWPVRAG
jgi:hypothetical protein